MILSDVLSLVPDEQHVLLEDNHNQKLFATAESLVWWLNCDGYEVVNLETDETTGDLKIWVNCDAEVVKDADS